MVTPLHLPDVEGPRLNRPPGRWSPGAREVARTQLKGSERTLYDILLDLTPIGFDRCRATEAQLAELIYRTVRTVRRAKRGLIAKGLIEIDLGKNFVIIWRFKRPANGTKPRTNHRTKMSYPIGQKCPIEASPPITPLIGVKRDSNEKRTRQTSFSLFDPQDKNPPGDPTSSTLPPPPPPPPREPNQLERCRAIFGSHITLRDLDHAVREAGGGPAGDERVDYILLQTKADEFVPDSFGYMITECRKLCGKPIPVEPPAPRVARAKTPTAPAGSKEPVKRWRATDAPEPPPPYTAAELAETVKAFSNPLPLNELLRKRLGRDAATGVIPADLAVMVPSAWWPCNPDPAHEKSRLRECRQTDPQPAEVTALSDTSVHVQSTEVFDTSNTEHQTARSQRARKDSNLQPSDSKSAVRSTHSVDATVPSVVTRPVDTASGLAPEAFPLPTSDSKPSPEEKHRGSRIRGSMRC